MPAARRRRRPRITSFSYHRLWYVLTREAALAVLATRAENFSPFSSSRNQLVSRGSDELIRRAHALCNLSDERRFRLTGSVVPLA